MLLLWFCASCPGKAWIRNQHVLRSANKAVTTCAFAILHAATSTQRPIMFCWVHCKGQGDALDWPAWLRHQLTSTGSQNSMVPPPRRIPFPRSYPAASVTHSCPKQTRLTSVLPVIFITDHVWITAFLQQPRYTFSAPQTHTRRHALCAKSAPRSTMDCICISAQCICISAQSALSFCPQTSHHTAPQKDMYM